jgi:hypothetical protein
MNPTPENNETIETILPPSPAAPVPPPAWSSDAAAYPGLDTHRLEHPVEPFARASLWCAVGGILVPFGAILGIVFGFVARARIKRSGGATKGDGLAIGGIVTGFVVIAASIAVAVALVTSHHSPSSNGAASVSPGVPANASGDAALAKQELIPTSAYPAGWKSQGSQSTTTNASFFGGGGAPFVGQMEDCLGMSGANVDTSPAEATTQEYDDPNSGVTVTDTVDVFSSGSAAGLDAAAAANPKAPGCLVAAVDPSFTTTLADNYFGNGTTAGSPTVADRAIPGAGNRDADIETSFTFTSQGVSGTFYLDQVLVQTGRSESNLWITNVGSQPPMSFVDQMVRAASTHLKDG